MPTGDPSVWKVIPMAPGLVLTASEPKSGDGERGKPSVGERGKPSMCLKQKFQHHLN